MPMYTDSNTNLNKRQTVKHYGIRRYPNSYMWAYSGNVETTPSYSVSPDDNINDYNQLLESMLLNGPSIFQLLCSSRKLICLRQLTIEVKCIGRVLFVL